MGKALDVDEKARHIQALRGKCMFYVRGHALAFMRAHIKYILYICTSTHICAHTDRHLQQPKHPPISISDHVFMQCV